MRYIFTDGKNEDFVMLCRLLDDYLNHIAGGEENRTQYIPLNTAEAIRDVVVAYDKGAPVGCAGFKCLEKGVAEVKRVFVRREYRSLGIATQMMMLLEVRAKEKGIKKLVLETGRVMEEAMGLYRSLGFEVTQNYGPYKCMEQSVCMKKDLSDKLPG